MKIRKKKILIAWGTGFIGYHLAKEAIKQGYQVTSLSKKKAVKKRFIKRVKYLFCDTCKIYSLKKKLSEDFDVVVNLSGHVNHREKKKNI